MKIEITSKLKNTTPYAGLYTMLKFTQSKVMPLVEENVFLEKNSMDKVKEKHILTCLSLAFIGGDKLQRVDLLKNDPLLRNIFHLNVAAPGNVAKFLNHFNFKSSFQLEYINILIAKQTIEKLGLRHITIDIDSSVKNLHGNQEGAEKGYNPEHKGNKCHNIQFAFCEELKLFVGGFLRPGNTNTCNGAKELVELIISVLGDSVEEITFRFDSGYFSESIVKIIESKNHKYVIRAKGYSTIKSNLRELNKDLKWQSYKNGKELATITTKPDNWSEERRFVISRERKETLSQVPLESFDEYDYYFFVTNQNHWTDTDIVWFYEKRGNSENHIKECKYDLSVNTITLNSFWASQALFQLQMMAYNIIIMFKASNKIINNELRETAKTFRLKYIYVCGKIIFGSRKIVLNISRNYIYKDKFTKLSG